MESCVYARYGASALAGHKRAREIRGGVPRSRVFSLAYAEMGGPELAEQLLALRPGVKVVFTSGYTNDAIARQGVLEPGVMFIQKPYRPKALAQRIREVLTEPSTKAGNTPSGSQAPIR
jgi:FixJ family two-component response regulator